MTMNDYTTSTVDGAAAHAAKHCEPEEEEYDDEEEEEEYDYDPCGCSDPGCPCDGYKRGGPI